MPEPTDSDYRALEEAEKLDGALYGTRLYSNTAAFALAQLREEYEAKLAAQRSRFGRRLARASIWRSWSGTASLVAGLTLALVGVGAAVTSQLSHPSPTASAGPARLTAASPAPAPRTAPSPTPVVPRPEQVASTQTSPSPPERAKAAPKRVAARVATAKTTASSRRRWASAESHATALRRSSRTSAQQRVAAVHPPYRRSPPANLYYRAYAASSGRAPLAPPPVQLTSSGGIARPLYGEELRRALREDRRRTRELNQGELDNTSTGYRDE